MSDFIEVTCPFCGEGEFDLPGLKGHILNGWCEACNELPVPLTLEERVQAARTTKEDAKP